jgi:hypothetical protein
MGVGFSGHALDMCRYARRYCRIHYRGRSDAQRDLFDGRLT